MKRIFAAALLLAGATAARAQDVKVPHGMVTVMREPDGTTLVFDTLLLTRLRPNVFSVNAMIVFPPVGGAARDTADSEIDHEELDCSRGMSRTWSVALFAHDSLVRDVEIGGPPQPVSEARLPTFRAMCAALAPFDRPEYDEKRLVHPPELINARTVVGVLSRAYPTRLRDAGVTGSATLQIRIDENGMVDTTSIRVDAATDPLFGEAAVRVAASMRFRPETIRGMRVGTSVFIPVEFALEPTPNPSASTIPGP